MAGTFSQIHIQVVFAVKFRDSVISEEWQERLYQYTTGVIQNNGHKVLAINGMPDHIHILIGLRPAQGISDLVNIIKSNTSKWVNESKFCKTRFEWQEGYGVFTYTKSHVPRIIDYVLNQKEHHKKETFREEYIKFLRWAEIEFDEKYIFKGLE